MLFKQLAIIVLALSLRPVASPLSVVSTQSKDDIPLTHGVHERQHPRWRMEWAKRKRISRAAILPMRIGLMQSNLEEGARHLLMM